MFLTKVQQQMDHRSVMAGFEAIETDTPRLALGILYRIDGGCTIVQSNVPPQLIKGSTTIHYKPEVIKGELYAFRVAVKCVERSQGKERCIDPDAWFERRLLGADFNIKAAERCPFADRASSGHIVPINRWNIEGLLTVTNPDLFLSNLKNGLGRGKAWGCGLLSIVSAV